MNLPLHLVLQTHSDWLTAGWKRFTESSESLTREESHTSTLWSSSLQRRRASKSAQQNLNSLYCTRVSVQSRRCAETLRKCNWYQTRQRPICRIQTWLEERKQEGGKSRDFSSSGLLEGTKMSKPNYSGTFHMVVQENMDAYLEALGKIIASVFLFFFFFFNSIVMPKQRS